MHRDLEGLCECRDCGLLQRLPEASQGSLLLCVRCRAVLRQVRLASLPLACCCAGTGLALLVLSLASPVASVATRIGRFSTSDVFTGPVLAKQMGAPVLALAVVATLLVLPLTRFASVLMLGLCIRMGRVPTWVRRLFSMTPALAVWSMVDVFLLGALIALTRLQRWAHVSFGPALYALAGVAVCSLAMDAALDRWAVWRKAPLSERPQAERSSVAWGCHRCGTVSRTAQGARCPRCARRLVARTPDSTVRAWAFGIAATLLLVPANVLPVMTVTQLGKGGPSTIVGGTFELAENGFGPTWCGGASLDGLRYLALTAGERPCRTWSGSPWPRI
jgi:paraquat-inducible protein A